MTLPVLIACSHGTSSPAGRECIDRLREEIAALRPGLDVLEAYVDVQSPALPDVVARLPAGVPAVVVPLLLSVGFHVTVDIANAVAGRERTTAAAPLGPDPRLASLLAERLAEIPGEWGVVLAAAGSSNPAAAENVRVLADQLSALRPGRIMPGYGSIASPSVADAVAALRAQGHPRVAIASYLLAPGFFHDQLAGAGADAVSGPLLPSAAVARIALDRYDDAVAAAGFPAPPSRIVTN
jgi:sirohydrochlorin ferrochelatase